MAFGIYHSSLSFETQGEIEIVDLTYKLISLVSEYEVKNGILTVFNPGSTGAITAMEYEPGAVADFKRLIKELAPKGANWLHDRIDNNAHSHLRAALIGPSLTIPIKNGELVMGTWQQPVFLELDIHPRRRRLQVTILGEK
ncbi:MAG: secondary thiamine-phosphate synthase enzyme YjbQ [Candidatus Kariarchaeaceae archaeon]